MNITITLGIALLVFVVLFFVAFKHIIKQKKENRDLQEELKTQQQNIISLYKHAEEIAAIEKDKNHTDKVIEEAKSDEEILDVINTIVSINNGRVRKQTKS